MILRWIGASTALGAMCLAATSPSPLPQDLREQVRQTELAFAQAMADRDHETFVSYLAEDAISFAGDRTIRGGEAVADLWRANFEGPRAPFAWEPEIVEVLDSGILALTSGPVRDPDGSTVGIFNTIWRLGANGDWKVVFDQGCAAPEE